MNLYPGEASFVCGYGQLPGDDRSSHRDSSHISIQSCCVTWHQIAWLTDTDRQTAFATLFQMQRQDSIVSVRGIAKV